MAGRHGHLDVIDKLIDEKGENFFSIGDYNDVLFQASWRGHLDIIKLMIQKGATNTDMGIQNATLMGHLDVVDYLKNLQTNNENQPMN